MGIKGLWEVRSHASCSLCHPLSRKQVVEPAAVEVQLLALALANYGSRIAQKIRSARTS